MPNEIYYLVSPAATRKGKNTQAGSAGAEIVILDDFRPRDSWQPLSVPVQRVLARLARSRIVTLHPERGR
jgi:hypothetical protein